MPIAIAAVSVALFGCGRVGVELIAFDDALDSGLVEDGSVESEAQSPDRDGADADSGLIDMSQGDPDAAEADAAPPFDAGRDAGAVTDAGDGGDSAVADAAQRCTTFGPFETPVPLGGLQISGNGWGPALSEDALTLYFAENTGTDERIMMATRPDRGQDFSPAVEVPNVQSSAIDATPFVTLDGLSLFFSSDRMGGLGTRDIWLSTRTRITEPFEQPTLLPNVNTVASEQHPKLSADGLTLLLNSNRGGGVGGHDIWAYTRTSTGSPFAGATNVAELNTTSEESSPVLSADGLSIVFSSNRPGGLGGNDLWMATRSSPQGPFSAPVNLTELNSTTTDSDCALSSDGYEIVFSSIRDGTRRLWRSIRTCN